MLPRPSACRFPSVLVEEASGRCSPAWQDRPVMIGERYVEPGQALKTAAEVQGEPPWVARATGLGSSWSRPTNSTGESMAV